MKKLQTRLAYSLLAVWTFTFIISLFPSCEIGLGGAVDTQPPSLTITNPKVDSVIRDKFLISGTWSDDGSLFSVKATLSRTDGKGKPVEIDGSFTQEERQGGSWQVLVDYREKNLIDGTYQASIAVKDKSGRITTQNTTFTIDNTAPVLVLSRPSIKDGQSGFDSYGRSFTLEGKAADDNDVSHIEVNIYENADSTEPMKTIGLDNVPLTIEQDVAIYESDKANDYSEIYGHTDENGIIFAGSDKTEQRYCTITIYDGAERFPVDGSAQTEEDKKGNSTNVYYMNSEIATLLQGKYKITDLYHIMNGNYGTDESRAASAEDIITLLEPYKVSKSKFSINPANNPKFILSSGNVLEEGKNLNNVDYQFTAGNRYIEVEIRPGLDGYPIDPDTVGVYLLECDEDGNPKNDEKIWLINTGADYHKTQEEVDTQGLDLDSGFGVYTVSGSTYKFKTSKMIHKTNYSVNTGHYYLVQVQGNDSQGESSGSIISDGTFAFKLVSNEEKIELSAHGVPDYLSKKAEAWAVAGHEAFTVTLNWATGEGPFKVYRQNGSGEDLVATVSEPTNGVWEAAESFNYSQLKALGSGDAFPEKLAYYLKNNSGDIISTTARINLKYDSAEPSITNVQFSNSYYKEDIKTYFVRNVADNLSNINGIATDDTGIEKVELKVGDTTVKSWPDGRFKFENVEFSGYTESGITANIVATDVAGNQKTYPLTIVFDKEAPHGVHAVDASIKDLYFRIGNADNDDVTPTDDKDKKVGGKYGNGTFGNATTIQIRGKFEDNANGSGVKMIYYRVYETENLLSDNPQTAEQQITDLISEVKEAPTGQFAPIETQTKRIFYNVGKKKNDQGEYLDPPVVDDSQIFEGSTAFTSTPNSKGFYKYYKDVESNYNNTLSGFKEGNNFLVLVVEDNVGNLGLDCATVNFNGVDTQFINYTLNVDTTPPSNITTNSHSGIIYTNSNTKPLDLWGTVSDKSSTESGSAGIKSFVLSRDGVDTKITASLREINDSDPAEIKAAAALDSTLRIWQADVSSLLPATSQTVSISATASDAAGIGNTTPAVVATINVDLVPPVVTVSEDSPTDADTSDTVIQVNGIITFTGTSDDENGIEELVGLYYQTYTGNTAPSAPAANTDLPPAGWTEVSADKSGTTSWKFTNINTAQLDGSAPIADGTKLCFTVAVKDKAGNIGYSTAKALVVDQDTDRPVIHLTSLPLTYKDASDQTQRMNSSNPVWFNRSELTGTIDDDDGAVEYVKVIAQDATETDAPSEDDWTDAANVYKNGIWAYTISSNGSKKIFFQIKEKGENGKTYTSNPASTSAETCGPKIQDVNSVKFGYNEEGNTPDDILYVKVDTDDPILDEMKYYTSSVLVEHPDEIPDYNSHTQEAGWKETESSIISDKFGGTNKYLYIKCKATDTNGISSVSVKFAGLDPLEGKTLETSLGNSKEIITCFNIKADTNPVPSGLTKLEINIKDNAADSTGSNGITKYYEAMVDNTDPEISFSNYSRGAQVYGSSAVTLRGTTSDSSKVDKVEFAITGGNAPENGWVEITDESKPTYTSKLGWQIVFDGKTPENDNEFTDPSSFHAELLKKYLFSLYNVAEGDQAGYDTTQKIYIWMRATDELGNTGTNIVAQNEEGFYLDVIPNGDRPAIQITYPAKESKVGGTIRITGTTEIQDTSASVKYVYLQIDPSYDSSTGFNVNGWVNELGELLTGVTSYHITDLSTAGENGGPVVVNGTTNLANVIGKGIASQGNSKMNWYLTINGNKEFNSKVSDNNRIIGIRAVAVSSTGKVSFSEVTACTIDPEAPTFGQTNELRFVQYSDNALTVESASRKFENGLYLKGQWYLVGSVEDDSGIREIKLGTQSIVYSTGEEGSEIVTNASNGKATEIPIPQNDRFSNYNLKIPVGNSTLNEFGKIEYEISVTDGSTSQIGNSLKFTVFYDNKAPTFEAQKGNEVALTENGKIYQSDGSYTVKGIFAEPSEGNNNQSGFNRIAMFFTRKRVENGNTNLYLIDPMIEDGEEGEDNFVKLGKVGNDGSITNFENNISLKEGLYWRQVTASLSNTNELTVAAGSLVNGKLPSNIRAGGLCMVNNVFYRIKSISGSKLILEGSISDFSNQPVYFAFAQVIDNMSQESGVVGLYQDGDLTTNQDGDCMVEGVIFGAGLYNWNASINSSNMLDGNVTMSFVAYDAAGNYTSQNINQKISNNAPRIAGVVFGTDTNLDGQIKGNEINETYINEFTNNENHALNGYDKFGNRKSEYTIPGRLTVKGAVMVKPMIVGGNKALGKEYRFSSTTGTGSYTSGVITYGAEVGHSSSNEVRDSDLTIDISLMNFIENNVKEGDQDITFTIWDKTDGSTLGDEASGSAKADIILPVNVIIADNEAPTINISPFYWNSQIDNSLYQNNVKNGHIELVGELPQGNDGDPMVSGKITFDGTATDNVIVQKLYASITGYNNGASFVIAERDKAYTSTDGWKSSSLFYKKNEQVVEGAANTLENKDWVFELLSDTYAEDGRNTVEFKFHFNTEKHPDAAKANVIFGYTAEDKGSPSSTGEYTNAHSSTDDVKVDIVPYITKVYTSLAKLKANNWSVYNRTALGHYAVASDETIYLYGFNLGNETNKPVYKYGNNAEDTITLAAPVNGGVTNLGTEDDPLNPPYPNGSEYATYSVVSFDVSNVPSSGEITLLVNGVPIQNNKNNKDAKGGYTGTTSKLTGDKTIYDNYYNRQPNGDNNNLLTDDLVLDIWDVNPTAVVPISGVTSQPVMAINPVNHDVGFAFVNGALYYSMPNGSSYSYDNFIGGFDYWTSVAMTYDSLGNSYGTAAGGDINETKADQLKIMTSRWGYADRHAGGYNTATNNLRLELIGQYDYSLNGSTYEGFRNFDKERIRSPSLVTGSATSDSTNVYLAYYDAINDEIRFKRGNIKSTKDATWKNLSAANKTASFFGDYYGGGSEAGDKVLGEDKDYSKYRTVHNSLIAGQTSRVYNTSGDTIEAKVVTTGGAAVYAGQYVSIAAIPNGGTNDDAVIAVWWDAFNNQLLYSYNLTPNSITVGQYTQADTKWSTPVPIFGDNIGEYCKVAVIKETDNNYSVHIVGYDGLNCDVWYAYIPTFTNPNSKKTCLVDSYGLIGTELNIDVALDSSGNPIPYISYYAGSCAHPKTAHWAGTTSIASSTLLSSVDEYEYFTGVWEVSVIPTKSRVTEDHINIGVWKDSTGTITWSTNDGAVPNGSNLGETKLDYKEVFNSNPANPGSGNTGYKTGGHVWGNGSKNPILGYSIKSGANGYIETAQMK